MAINPSQDSLQPYVPKPFDDSIYSTHRQSGPKTSANQTTKYTDTIERSAATEAMNRLQRPSENMVFQPNVLFRRIGKVVFLTVAMPPYFLLYGLPKWILVEGFQVLTLAMTWLANGLKEKTEKPIKFVIQKINLLVFLVQMSAKRLIKPVVEIGIQLRQFFQNMAQRFGKASAPFFSKTKNLLTKTLLKPQELLNNLIRNVQERWKNARSLTKNTALRLNAKIEDGVNWVKQAPQLLLGWGSARLQSFNQLHEGFRRKIGNKFAKSSKIALHCTNWVSEKMGTIGNLAKKACSPVASFFQRIIKPIMQLLSKIFQAVISQSGKFFGNAKKRILSFLGKVQLKIKALTPQDALEKLFPSSFLAKLPAFIRKILTKIKENSLTFALFRIGVQFTRLIVMSTTTLTQKIIEGLATLVNRIATSLAALKQFLKSVSAGTIRSMQSGAKTAKNGSKNGLHSVLVVICMTGILLAWGFESMSEITSRWFSKISFFSHKNQT